MKWLHRFLVRRAARRMSLAGHQSHRERVKAKARQMCMEMGKDVPRALQ